MKTFARAIQLVRWLYDDFDKKPFQLEKTSSEAITVDMGSLGKELSVYLVKSESKEELDKIALKVFIDCLGNYKDGVTLILFSEDYVISNGYKFKQAKEPNPFGVDHYNITKVDTSECIFKIADYIGDVLLKGENTYVDYDLDDLFVLFCMYKDIIVKYERLSEIKKEKLHRLFSKSKDRAICDDLFGTY